MKKTFFINEKRPHDSARKHVSGLADYTDDINEPNGTLHGAVGWSKQAHALIKKIDLSEVWKSEGVITVITTSDIPGRNDVGPVFNGDPIFPSKKVEFYGQPLFAVAATSTELARKAVLKAKIAYKILKPIITIKEALKKKNFILKGKKIQRGNPTNAILKSKNFLKGNFTTGSQEHFYLEGQVAFVIPKEDKDLLVYSSTQHPSETQQIIAKMLNQKSNSVTVLVRRIGGGFGGKETNFLTSSICALLASKTNKPVKLRLDRDDDIIMTGKRHDFYSDFEVGFNDVGVIEGLKIKLASRCGMSADLSGAINERALLHIDNAYYLSNVQIQNYLCKTNTVSSTAFRGFGGNQGMMAIENIIDNIARYLEKDPAQVRKKQFLKQLKLEKQIEKFRIREIKELEKLEKISLKEKRDDYAGLQARIEKLKDKYRIIRDQKIRERVEALGVKTQGDEDRETLLQKEKDYKIARQKIELSLESFYRSASSLVFQLNKRHITRHMSIFRCIDQRFETGEIFIKWDEAPDEEWLLLIYIKNNSPDEGIVIEDKSDPEKNSSHEFKSNEIFKASDLMVDSLTQLISRKRVKKD
ncbi:molybdopterin-dependent oxidoreductase [Candidatus Pelagibacter sp.]|nr:molybdopterin-dependent oxidoreductase [Candidatus Pelagibacter sp.]